VAASCWQAARHSYSAEGISRVNRQAIIPDSRKSELDLTEIRKGTGQGP
jgi:hypothetical protein